MSEPFTIYRANMWGNRIDVAEKTAYGETAKFWVVSKPGKR